MARRADEPAVPINSARQDGNRTGSTVADLVIAAIARYPERKAFVSDEAVVTYRELGEWISRLAQWFDSLGLKPGATVACGGSVTLKQCGVNDLLESGGRYRLGHHRRSQG